jgi:branched-chain amino acid transport system ATP-binding protein
MSSEHAGLEVVDVECGYDAMRVVQGVTFEVRPNEIVALLGRNGAGKTTTLLAISGLRYGRWKGHVSLNGLDISSLDAAHIVGRGMALVPEGHRIFRALTVRENLEVGATPVRGKGRSQKGAEDQLDRVFTLFPILQRYADRNAGFLSGGEQQMVAIGQALMAEPQVILLDEPTSGLSPQMSRTIYETMVVLRNEGLAVLVVDQNIRRGLQKSDRFYVMDDGRIAASGISTDAAAHDSISTIVRGVAE